MNNGKLFIEKAISKHGSLYDYSRVCYVNSCTKVIIICKIHGEFLQTPGKHIFGQECPKCALIKRDNNRRDTIDDFVKKSVKVHGHLYDYSLVEYVNSHTKVKIVCSIHGEFYQTPRDHINSKSKCPMCSGRYDRKYSDKNIPLFETYNDVLSSVGIVCKRSNIDKNILSVRCFLCRKFYIPTEKSVSRKRDNINNFTIDGSNLYCSDKCKNSCPSYRFKSVNTDPRSILYIPKSEQQMARNCQTNHLKQLQCDEFGYNYCEKCGDIIDVELHHTMEVNRYGKESINSSGHMLLCAGCHTKLHRECN